MPTELNRIRELSGLQQEAAVSLKGKESALKAWYNKYSKYTGGNGDPLPFGLIKAYTESGIISDGYEENELAKAEKALGKKEMDWEDQDWQKVYSMTPITQGMEKDLLTATGSKTVDEELLAKVYDVIEDMYPSYDQVLGKKESAVAEAPAGLTAPQKQGLAALVKKYAKRKTYGGGGLIDGYLDYLAQTGVWTDAADEKEFDVALKKLGHDDLDAWEQDAEGEEFGQFLELSPITGQAQNDVEKVLGKGFYNNTTLINAASDYVRSLPETAVQPEPVLNAVINNSTMPQELDRIRELSGLQQEAPASGDQALAKDLANHFMKKANSFKSRGDTGPEYEEMVDIAKAFQQGQDQGMEEINDLANFEFSAHPFGGKFSNNEGEPEDEVLAILNKHGYSFTEKSHPERPNRGLVTLIKKGANTSKSSQTAAQPVNSSVDDTIQRARAQIETLESALKEDYKKFQGMKPYKPKKK